MSLKVTVGLALASVLVVAGCGASPPRSSSAPQSTIERTSPGQGTGSASRTPGPTATHQPTATPPGTPVPTTPVEPAVGLRVGRPAWVAVSVATLWRSPASPRPVDAPALRSPADIRVWLRAMTMGDRRGLQGRADTQVLLGDRVLVTALRAGWAKIVVPDQPTPLDPRGYPGWVPSRQLSGAAPPSATTLATVVVPTTWLRTDTSAGSRVVEVSFGTRLPVLGRRDGWLRVGLPGEGVRRVDAAVVVEHRADQPALPATGSAIVRSAETFTGLPYLWAGRSGFGFDCSGLTSLLYRVHGLVIPRDADAQALKGRRVRPGALSPGDLLFYATPSGYVHHVSLYAGSGQMVQSPATGQSVQTIPMSRRSYAIQFAGARRLVP